MDHTNWNCFPLLNQEQKYSQRCLYASLTNQIKSFPKPDTREKATTAAFIKIKPRLVRRRQEQASHQGFLTGSTHWKNICEGLLTSAFQVTAATDRCRCHREPAGPSGCKGDHAFTHSSSSWNLKGYPKHQQTSSWKEQPGW